MGRIKVVKEEKKSPLSTDTIDVKSLCGFYCIVYDDWTGTENGFDSQNGDAYNYLTLSIESSGPLDKGAPEKVTGSIRLWDKIGTFGALVRDEGETENRWAMDKVEWAEIQEDDEDPGGTDEDDLKKRQRFGHGIAVLKTLDDRGRPFVELNYNMGPNEFDRDSALVMVKAVGKKQKNDKCRFGLTEDEAERLMEDGVADELEGLGWVSWGDREDEDNERGKSAPLIVNQSESTTEDVVAGTKRKAEDQVDDSTRRSAPRKD
ncbi:hypothetical protein PILCRDRAFT_1673 [Piloderma croceum F 1598]|uniref:Uncharacterized protein n=1 Tax=Piloderma croceum (strain F 1598) TaxID=765440 RepID=A0A0C3BUX7_PILCF|nr:hypothetical protein PILCRDRAFT_1673 [Piloderma croceum F 1598]